jgi:hypothetical protein
MVGEAKRRLPTDSWKSSQLLSQAIDQRQTTIPAGLESGKLEG